MDNTQTTIDHQEPPNLPEQKAARTCDELPLLEAPKPGQLSDQRQQSSIKTELHATLRKHEPESFAKERMSAAELGQYEEWQNSRLQPPEFNWAQNVMPVPSDTQALKTFLQSAAAMDIIWRHQGASAENAAWLATHMALWLPLVKAVTKVLSAQKHLQVHDPLARLSHSQVAEIQTLRLITAAAEENVTREREQFRKLTELIRETQAIFRDRLKTLKL